MQWLTWLNSRLSRWALYLAVACLMGIVGVVFGSVIWRYALNDAPAWSEQVALILVINVAMFGAAAGVRDEGHIGMESLTSLLHGDRIVVRRSEHTLRLLHPIGWSYFDTLRKKLHWNEGA